MLGALKVCVNDGLISYVSSKGKNTKEGLILISLSRLHIYEGLLC